MALRVPDVLDRTASAYSHQQLGSMHSPICFGGCTWFAENMECFADNLKQARPDFFLGAPRVWEKIQERMEAVGAQATPLRRRLVRWAWKVGLAAGYAAQGEGRAWPACSR